MTYHTVNFISKLNETMRMSNIGILISEDVVAGWNIPGKSYALYNQYGYKITNLSFVSIEDTINFGKFFLEMYGDFLILWHEDQRAKIPELTRWTVDNGLIVLDTITSLIGEPITFSQFEEAYHARLSS